MEQVDALSAEAGGGPVTIVVDDVELLKQSPLEHALTGVAPLAVFCVAIDGESGSTLFGGPYAVAKKARAGLVLSPTNGMVGTQVLGVQIPRFMLGTQTPGGGVLHRDGAWIPVRVPDVRQ